MDYERMLDMIEGFSFESRVIKGLAKGARAMDRANAFIDALPENTIERMSQESLDIISGLALGATCAIYAQNIGSTLGDDAREAAHNFFSTIAGIAFAEGYRIAQEDANEDAPTD
jgi:hypothetical protein